MSFENLSDAELMMIEQLTYFGGFGDEKYEGKTIGYILNDLSVSEYGLSGLITKEEAKAICEYMKNNEDISNLVLQDVVKDGDRIISYCFTESVENPVEAIVAFKGTTQGEWGDNCEGLNISDTERQLDAREYIEGNYVESAYIPGEYIEGREVNGEYIPGEYVPGRQVNCEYIGGLPYEDITVIGHSKGGNKAMYTAILCDNVKRCISMDGQGFSAEFFEEYGYEISQKAHIIKNYSVSKDIVHGLMMQIPGSEQIYCEGFRLEGTMDCHKSSAFFQLDKNGNILCEDGEPVISTGVSEDPAVKMLHEFTCYIINVATDEDKADIANFLSTVIDMKMIDDCSVAEIAKYLNSHPEELALILAYLVKYMDTYDLTYEDIDGLLEVIGLKTLDEIWSVTVRESDIKPIYGLAGLLVNYIDKEDDVVFQFGLSDIFAFLQNNLSDKKKDIFISFVLKHIPIVGYNVDTFWNKIEKKVNSIPNVSKEEGIKEPQITVSGDRVNSSVGELLIVDTNKLRTYANMLDSINKRLDAVDKKLDDLYLRVGVLNLPKLIMTDYMISLNSRLTGCSAYLNATANAFETTEREVKNLF